VSLVPLGRLAALLLLAASATGCQETVAVAPGFTEATFNAVPIGSSAQQVLATLGEPLERWNSWNSGGVWDKEYWSYRQRTNFAGTHHAVLIFAPRGPLQDRSLDWYVD
jgi:hypothetical protein